MINKKNYFDNIEKIDVVELPKAMQDLHSLIADLTDNGADWSAYDDDAEIKRIWDLQFSKLEEWIEKNKPVTESVTSEYEKTDTGKKEKKHREQAKQKLTTRSKRNKQKKSKAKPQQPKESKPEPKTTEKKTKQKPARAKHSEKGKQKAKAYKDTEASEKYLYPHAPKSLVYIKRYVGMVNREVTDKEILNFINALQKSIVKKEITRKSRFVEEIDRIQNNLIKIYKTMDKRILITMDNKDLRHYNLILENSGKIATVNYIIRFINLYKNPNLASAQKLHTSIKNALEKGKITESDMYYVELVDVMQKLATFLKYKKGIQLTPVELNGLGQCCGVNGLGSIDDINQLFAAALRRVPGRSVGRRVGRKAVAVSTTSTKGGSNTSAVGKKAIVGRGGRSTQQPTAKQQPRMNITRRAVVARKSAPPVIIGKNTVAPPAAIPGKQPIIGRDVTPPPQPDLEPEELEDENIIYEEIPSNNDNADLIAKYLQNQNQPQEPILDEDEGGFEGMNGHFTTARKKKNETTGKEIIKSTELKDKEFKKIGFTGKWLKLIGDPVEPWNMMIWAKPGKGKSSLAIALSKYLAQEFDRQILYIAKDEGNNSYTMQEKFARLNAFHPNIHISDGTIPKNLRDYDYVFFDLMNEFNFSYEQFKNLVENNRPTCFISIFKSTGDGNYRGAKDWENLFDVSLYINDEGYAKANKNRFGAFGVIKFLDTKEDKIYKYPETQLLNAEKFVMAQQKKGIALKMVKGDDGKIWVVTPEHFQVLKENGYKTIN